MLEDAARPLNEVGPHESPRGVVGEGEVDLLVEELLEVLLRALLHGRGAPNNRDPCGVLHELGALLPLGQHLLYSCRVVRVGGFQLFGPLLALLFLLLGWPRTLTLVDVDYGWLVLLGDDHGHGHQNLVAISFSELALDVDGTQVEEHRVSLGDASSHG